MRHEIINGHSIVLLAEVFYKAEEPADLPQDLAQDSRVKGKTYTLCLNKMLLNFKYLVIIFSL